MRPGKANPASTTYSFNILRAWLAEENTIKTLGGDVVTALQELLDEHDKLLKYCRIVVKCHEHLDFGSNVNAIRTYLVEELKIEP